MLNNNKNLWIAEFRDKNNESLWSLPESIGSGFFREISLKKGFDLFLLDYKVKESFCSYIDKKSPALAMAFNISGHTTGKVLKDSRSIDLIPGGNELIYYPDSSGEVIDIKESHRHSLTLIIDPGYYDIFIKKELNNAGFPFLHRDDFFHVSDSLTHEMIHVVLQIFNFPLKSPARKLYLESKALELIALKIDQFVLKEKSHDCDKLKVYEKNKIVYISKILHENMESPPSLFQLAKEAGISHVKLNLGFKQLFGTTVFGYLRDIRLEKARKLIEKSGMNVTEAAFTVGYNSLSSFSRAFADKYNHRPCDLK